MSWTSATKKSREVIPPPEKTTKPSARQQRLKELLEPAPTPRFEFEPAPIEWDKLVTLDFETYFDSQYTLRKQSLSEYVRDRRFRAQMVGIKIGKKATKIYPHDKIEAALRRIDWSTHSLLCHNTQFDGFILSHHYGIIPKRYYDTLSMARGLHSNEIGASLDAVANYYGKGNKVPDVLMETKGVFEWPKALAERAGAYCAQDVELCYEVFREMHQVYPPCELDLIHMTIRMFCAPVLRLDIPRAQAEHERELNERKRLLLSAVDIEEYDDTMLLKTKADRELEGEERALRLAEKIIGSNECFTELLTLAGVPEKDLPTKVSAAWAKRDAGSQAETMHKRWAPAYSRDDLAFVDLPTRVWDFNPQLSPKRKKDRETAEAIQRRLQQLVDARLAVKSTTNITRAERMLELGRDGLPIPIGYSYYRAHTGRWSGNNKSNFQNLTRGGELRLSIMAAPGHMMAVADSSQIEARVNAWLWDETELLAAFREKRDIYSEFATKVYGRPITKADKTERHVGKISVLGLGFGMSWQTFQGTMAKGAMGGPRMELEDSEARKIVNLYRTTNAKIKSGWDTCDDWIEWMSDERNPVKLYKCLEISHQRIRLPNGMYLKYPQLTKSTSESGRVQWTYQSGEGTKYLYGAMLCENLVQALARIIVADQMLAIDARYPIVMTTHDEAVAHPKAEEAQACFDYMLECMTTPPWWCKNLPVAAEGGYAANYSK